MSYFELESGNARTQKYTILSKNSFSKENVGNRHHDIVIECMRHLKHIS